jgi:hypothetical protein
MDLFFLDYDMVPLFIQDNYLNAMKQSKPKQATKQTKKGKKNTEGDSEKK